MDDDENLLMLSGIQHFYFCKRQWSLIHAEGQWAENRLTVEGAHLHENADNPFLVTKKRGVVTLRAVRLLSKKLGFCGIADIVELHPCDAPENAIRHPKHRGFWRVVSVEYKRGRRKPDKCDEIQLCAQTMCLEEMFGVALETGFLYYGEENRRFEVLIDDELRAEVVRCATEMHAAFDKRRTFAPVYKAHCKSCSLEEICMPKILSDGNAVKKYLEGLSQ